MSFKSVAIRTLLAVALFTATPAMAQGMWEYAILRYTEAGFHLEAGDSHHQLDFARYASTPLDILQTELPRMTAGYAAPRQIISPEAILLHWMGRQGWELVTLTADSVFYFKRPGR